MEHGGKPNLSEMGEAMPEKAYWEGRPAGANFCQIRSRARTSRRIGSLSSLLRATKNSKLRVMPDLSRGAVRVVLNEVNRDHGQASGSMSDEGGLRPRIERRMGPWPAWAQQR
jgi:hypothetical protein